MAEYEQSSDAAMGEGADAPEEQSDVEPVVAVSARSRRVSSTLGVALLSAVMLLIGVYLVLKTSHSNNGSPVGWLAIVVGLLALLVTFGLVIGFYDE